MLRLERLSCGYGAMRAVHALDLEVPGGLITALLGANGSGKSSTIMCIAGHVPVQEGRLLYHGEDISRTSPMARVKAGIAVVPEGRRLFPSLTVKENLVVGGYTRPPADAKTLIGQVMTLFPRLHERIDQLAGSLSGGEQQMLAIGRALMSEPQLLMVDELSLGLMPKITAICYEAIMRLKETGLTIVLVEQNTRKALEVADRVCILESGHKVWYGTATEAVANPELTDVFLGIKTADAQQP